MEDTLDPYVVLGVPRTATQAEIKAAHRRKSKAHHPDRHGGNDELMSQVNVANSVLSDPEKRAEYDRTGVIHEESKEARYRNVLMKAVRGCLRKPGNIVTHVRRELTEAMDEGKVIIDNFSRDLQMNRARLELVKGPQDEHNMIADVIEEFVKDGEKRLSDALKQMDSLRGAREILDTYESSETEVASDEEDKLMKMLDALGGLGSMPPFPGTKRSSTGRRYEI
jgi:curved DNA-binding protein CbpA